MIISPFETSNQIQVFVFQFGWLRKIKIFIELVGKCQNLVFVLYEQTSYLLYTTKLNCPTCLWLCIAEKFLRSSCTLRHKRRWFEKMRTNFPQDRFVYTPRKTQQHRMWSKQWKKTHRNWTTHNRAFSIGWCLPEEHTRIAKLILVGFFPTKSFRKEIFPEMSLKLFSLVFLSEMTNFKVN